jgi:hypothetical protein
VPFDDRRQLARRSAPDIAVSGIAPSLRLVMPSASFRMRNGQLLANWPCSKSADQRQFGFAYVGLDAYAVAALRRAFSP